MSDEVRCPRCGSSDAISHGKTKRRRLRRKCNACGRTFSLTTGTVMFSRKLKAIEDSVKIAPATAYLWRMKAYTAAKVIRDRAALSGRV